MSKKTKTDQLLDRLDEVLKNQKKILQKEQRILGEEEKIEEYENRGYEQEQKVETQEGEALEELHKLEQELKTTFSSPIKKITKRDLFKGFIGAFVGVISHFAFAKAVNMAPELSLWRTTMLYVVAFFIIIVMLYYTGFKNVQRHIVLQFMPLRALILYVVSIITVILVYILFGKLSLPLQFLEIYRQVGAAIILAVIGAGTADLIGRGE